jgi:Rieske Fe-S protein
MRSSHYAKVMEKLNYMTLFINRRSFLKKFAFGVTGIMAILAGIPVVKWVIDHLSSENTIYHWTPLARLTEFQSNEPQAVFYNTSRQSGSIKTQFRQSVFVLKRSTARFVVLSSTCTHMGCTVKWERNLQQFICPCHGGVFDKEGNKLSGPPKGPLVYLDTKIEKGKLYIKEVY